MKPDKVSVYSLYYITYLQININLYIYIYIYIIIYINPENQGGVRRGSQRGAKRREV